MVRQPSLDDDEEEEDFHVASPASGNLPPIERHGRSWNLWCPDRDKKLPATRGEVPLSDSP